MASDFQSHIAKIRNCIAGNEDYQAVCDLRQIIKNRPEHGEQWQAIAELCHSVGDMDAGLIAARNFAEGHPEDPGRQGMLSEFLVATGRIQEAFDLMVPLAEKYSEHAPLHYSIGVMLSQLGRVEEAETRFTHILDIQPNYILAWEQLAQIHEFKSGDPWIGRYRQVEELEHLIPDEDKPPFFYGLGKLYDDLGDYDKAFASFQKAAAIKNRISPFNREAFNAHVERLENLFSAELFAKEQDSGIQSNQPIFIVGVPRSGSSLIDRIISAHSDVTSGGEMSLFWLAALPFDTHKNGQPLSLTSYHMEKDATWTSIAQDYLDRLQERLGSCERITDKSLVNYLYIHAIMQALPKAKIIYCRRDPVDTAWSNFRTLFGTDNLMSYDLDDIALYQHSYHRLMKHWQKLRPGTIFEIRHEELVSQPEQNIKRLLDFCDLEFEEGCLLPHISDTAMETAKNYASHLEPWLEKLRGDEKA